MSISGISSAPSISYPQPTQATSQPQPDAQAQNAITSQTLAAQQTASTQQSSQVHHHHHGGGGGKHAAAQSDNSTQSGTTTTGGVNVLA
jgi:hypothetical protein